MNNFLAYCQIRDILLSENPKWTSHPVFSLATLPSNWATFDQLSVPAPHYAIKLSRFWMPNDASKCKTHMLGTKEETWNEEGVPGTWVLGHLGWKPEKEHGSFSLGFLLWGWGWGAGAVRGLSRQADWCSSARTPRLGIAAKRTQSTCKAGTGEAVADSVVLV